MATLKFSQMSVASTLTGVEDVPLVQSGGSKKTAARNIAKIGYQDVVSEVGTTKTLALSDRGAWLRFTNAAGATLTVPSNTTAGFEIGTMLNGVQAAAGQVTITAAVGVTINKPSGLLSKTRVQGSAWCLIKVATDTWDLVGDLEVAP